MAQTFRHVFLPLNTLCMRNGFGMWHNETTTAEGVYDLMGTINHFTEGIKGRADFLQTDVKLLLQVYFLFLITSVFILKDQAPHVAAMPSEISSGREVLSCFCANTFYDSPESILGIKWPYKHRIILKAIRQGPFSHGIYLRVRRTLRWNLNIFWKYTRWAFPPFPPELSVLNISSTKVTQPVMLFFSFVPTEIS